jgi:hypothetical protein
VEDVRAEGNLLALTVDVGQISGRTAAPPEGAARQRRSSMALSEDVQAEKTPRTIFAKQ